MCISSFTPPIEPGTLPRASAATTCRRTVPFFRCMRLAGILVKKLNTASEPTANSGLTLSPKMRTGSSNTPPPTPVKPMRMPTIKPTKILNGNKGMVDLIWTLANFGVDLLSFRAEQNCRWLSAILPGRVPDFHFETTTRSSLRRPSIHADKPFPLEMQNDLLRRFLGRQVGRVDRYLRIGRRFVRIGDSGELLNHAGACLGIQPLAIALFADFNRSRHVHQDESAIGIDQLSHVLAGGVIRRNRRTDCNSAVFGDLRGNIADPPDVDITMFFRESQLRRQVFAHQIAIEQRNRTSTHFQEFRQQHIGDGRLPRARESAEEDGHALFAARWKAAP